MRTSDVTQLMDLALGLWFPFVRIMAFLRYVPVLDNSALTVRVRIILSLALAIIIYVVAAWTAFRERFSMSPSAFRRDGPAQE